MQTIKLYPGLDVHKDSITPAIAQAGLKGEIRLYVTITNDLHALEKSPNLIRKTHPDDPLGVSYEAVPCGFGIGHKDIATAQLCTHVMQKPGLGVRSPIDG